MCWRVCALGGFECADGGVTSPDSAVDTGVGEQSADQKCVASNFPECRFRIIAFTPQRGADIGNEIKSWSRETHNIGSECHLPLFKDAEYNSME